MKHTSTLLITIWLLAGVASAEPANVPHTFSAGSKAVASEVNANFQALSNAINATQNQLDSLIAPPAETIGVLTINTKSNVSFDVEVYRIEFGADQPPIDSLLAGSRGQKFNVTELEFLVAEHPKLTHVLLEAAKGVDLPTISYESYDGLLSIAGTTLLVNGIGRETGTVGTLLSLQYYEVEVNYGSEQVSLNVASNEATGCSALSYALLSDQDINIDPKLEGSMSRLYWAEFLMWRSPYDFSSMRGYTKPEMAIQARVAMENLPCLLSLIGKNAPVRPELTLQYGTDPSGGEIPAAVEMVLTNPYVVKLAVSIDSRGEKLEVDLFPRQLEMILQGDIINSFRWDLETAMTFQ